MEILPEWFPGWLPVEMNGRARWWVGYVAVFAGILILIVVVGVAGDVTSTVAGGVGSGCVG